MSDSFTVHRPRYLIPAFGRLYDRLSDVAWLVLRVTVGASLIPHGMQKLFMAFNGPGMDKFIASLAGRGFPAPTLMGWLVALTELVGGTLLALGLLTRPAAAAVFVFMMVAVFSAHLPNGFFWTDKGFEYPLMWGIAALFFLIRGGGPYSVDRAIGREI
ncbi:DoxX family protein [Methylobacterium sp. WSM2598]|uniref:DoxX family protein n=1 Tax=Methylobacterium sp. WSM2598 TaxID=398261 RepID=UPI0003780D2A|nr:DoxX family protein [Methylobacterium sp. WSM2598]